MDLGISGKRAIVIGGSSGLGLAVSERLAEEGVHLILFARNAAKLESVSNDLETRYAVKVECCAGDISNEADIERLRRYAEIGKDVQILILNTPRPPSPMRDFLDEQDEDRWASVYDMQLRGAILVLRKIAPLIKSQGWGRIIGITSASVKPSMPRHAISTIFRAGMQAALKHLSMELAGNGVTVNTVAPATIITPTFASYHNLEARLKAVPANRGGKPEELAATVAFLASIHGGFISGQTIQIDGGATLALC